MADTTDVPREDTPEGDEEEDRTEDEPVAPETGMQNLLDRIKVHQNSALAQELWYEAAQMQQAVIILFGCVLRQPTNWNDHGSDSVIDTKVSNTLQVFKKQRRRRDGRHLPKVH